VSAKPIHPHDLYELALRGRMPEGPVSLDTETSGLFVDAGARVSTVSVAWVDDGDRFAKLFDGLAEDENGRQQLIWDSGIMTRGVEKIDQWDEAMIVSFAWPFDQGVEGTGKKEDTGQGLLWGDNSNLGMAQWIELMDWLAKVGPQVGLNFHHAKFDLHMMKAGVRRWPDVGGIDLQEWVEWDTQNGADLLTAHLNTSWVNTASGLQLKGTTSLKPTSAAYWGEGETDEQRVIKEYLRKRKLPAGRWDLMPWDVIAKYADQDARLTARMRLRQEYDLSATRVKGWLDGEDGRMTPEQALDRRLRTSKMLMRIERRGVPFSVAGAQEDAESIRGRIKELEALLPFQPPTLPMAKHYWFGEGDSKGVRGLGLTPYSTTDKGAAQLDAQIIQKMVDANIPGAEVWQAIQKLSTSLSRWYEGWTDRAGKDGRLRPSFRQNGTASGRFSMENIQLQAIPNDYKLKSSKDLAKLRTPRTLIGDGVPEGWKLWELDLMQAELRVAAMFADCKRMLELIDQGADLHADAAINLFTNMDMNPNHPAWGEYRQVAKRGNFSLIFGIGPTKLKADIETQTGIILPEHEVKSIHQDWNALYPEYRQAILQAQNTIERRMSLDPHGRGFITLLNGERRWFQPSEKDSLYTKGFNQRVQANLAQYGIDWWLTVEEAIRDELGDEVPGIGGVGMVLMVHDSMALLLPDDARGVELVQLAVDTGIDIWRKRFPGVPGGIDVSGWSDHA